MLTLISAVHSSVKPALSDPREQVATYIAYSVALASSDVDWEPLFIHATANSLKMGFGSFHLWSTKPSTMPIMEKVLNKHF